jgi:hypothetical protein
MSSFFYYFFIVVVFKLATNVLGLGEVGDFDRNASANPNVTQNRNLSNVLRNPGFANALLCPVLN